MLHPRELCVHPQCAALRKPHVLTEVSVVVVSMEDPLLSHSRLFWQCDKEVTVPNGFSVAAHGLFLPAASVLKVCWQSSRILGYSADGILMGIGRKYFLKIESKV